MTQPNRKAGTAGGSLPPGMFAAARRAPDQELRRSYPGQPEETGPLFMTPELGPDELDDDLDNLALADAFLA